MNPQIKHIDQAKTPPTLVGQYGAAWRINCEESFKAYGGDPEAFANISAWIVYAPNSHPFWPYVLISCTHLRGGPKIGEAVIFLPGATHQLSVAALDPREVPDPAGKLRVIHPMNFAGQFKAAARPNPVDLDRAAAERIEFTVNEILRGELNPDTDGTRQWIARFGGHLLRR
jgi:hypothetical protein